jgi:hypothetical protein
MNTELKIKLLKRKFQSMNYIEEFIANYQEFVKTGLDALEAFKIYRKSNPQYVPDKVVAFEEGFWEDVVKPNFKGMQSRSKEALADAQQGDKSTVRSLAASFRGLSRGFDGVDEEFMDVVDPEVRKKYLALYNLTSDQATIIESTINDWWDDDEILRETITGPIDEKELLDYFEPGETV